MATVGCTCWTGGSRSFLISFLPGKSLIAWYQVPEKASWFSVAHANLALPLVKPSCLVSLPYPGKLKPWWAARNQGPCFGGFHENWLHFWPNILLQHFLRHYLGHVRLLPRFCSTFLPRHFPLRWSSFQPMLLLCTMGQFSPSFPCKRLHVPLWPDLHVFPILWKFSSTWFLLWSLKFYFQKSWNDENMSHMARSSSALPGRWLEGSKRHPLSTVTSPEDFPSS